MTWWLSATADELKRASTCERCGCSDADIDLHLCFDCFSQLPKVDQWRKNRDIASKYGLSDRVAEADRKIQECE